MLRRALPWIFLLSGWIALASYICSWFFCSPSVAAAVAAPAAAPIAAVAAVAAVETGVWDYNDGEAYSMSHEEYFKFPESEFSFMTPLTNKFSQSIEKTATYLKGNSSRQLTVTGYYKDGEENTSVFPNLGMARANSVAAYLTRLGVPPTQTISRGLPIEEKWFKDEVLIKGVDFSFAAKSETDSRIPTIAANLVGKPLTLYFQTNQNTPDLSVFQRKSLADMFYYVESMPNSRITVSGHTDNVGSRDYNLRLSKDRAKFVKDYLVERGGVDESKLRVEGFGPDRPIKSNDTSEGRSKNRRVQITLQKS